MSDSIFHDAPQDQVTNPAHQLGGQITPTAIILHRTIGHWQGDYNVLKNGGAVGYISVHFLVGQDEGQWVQFAPVDVLCNHAAGDPGNGNAFGIEISGTMDEPLTDWQIDRVAAIINWAATEWGIPPVKYDGAQGRIDTWNGVIDHRHIVAPKQFAHFDGVEDDDWAKIAAKIAGGTIAPAPAPGPAPVPAPASNRMLRQGDQGADVADVQRRLGIPADGIFGPQTDAAVRAFQSAHGLSVDGIVGPQTRGALDGAAPAGGDPQIQQGSQGPAVSAAQQLLNQHGASITVDGIFGPQTDAAVRDFQGSHGCAVDGVVGPQTWAALRG